MNIILDNAISYHPFSKYIRWPQKATYLLLVVCLFYVITKWDQIHDSDCYNYGHVEGSSFAAAAMFG